jgi:hypothetical protein
MKELARVEDEIATRNWFDRRAQRATHCVLAVRRSLSLDPDIFVILLVFCYTVIIGVYRVDYAGDGLRHISHILVSHYPELGQPRWLLFPTLLYFVIKPFALLGIVDTPVRAAQIFAIFNAACGSLCLLCLRVWLTGLTPWYRAATLFLASSTVAFLIPATQTIEPPIATLIALAGLTFARHATLSDQMRLPIAVAAICLASLIYQGLLFALFLIPTTFPAAVYATRHALFRSTAIIVLVPLIVVTILTMAGDSPQNAARRFLHGENNSFASAQYSEKSIKNLAGVALVGPAYNLTGIPDLRGLSGSVAMLQQRSTFFEALIGLLPWLVAALAYLCALVFLVIRRQYDVLVGIVGMTTLPLIRMSQYSYVKYYVLLPALIVMAIPRLEARLLIIGLLGGLLFASNATQDYVANAKSKQIQSRLDSEFWPQFPHGACYIGASWGPPVSSWRSESFGWLSILLGDNTPSREKLRASFRKIFCQCADVVTDSLTRSKIVELTEQLSPLDLSDIPISDIVLDATAKSKVFEAPAFSLYQFSAAERKRACMAVSPGWAHQQ